MRCIMPVILPICLLGGCAAPPYAYVPGYAALGLGPAHYAYNPNMYTYGTHYTPLPPPVQRPALAPGVPLGPPLADAMTDQEVQADIAKRAAEPRPVPQTLPPPPAPGHYTSWQACLDSYRNPQERDFYGTAHLACEF